MGLKAKDILRGVGAGLSRFGEIEKEEEAQAKKDARQATEDAFKERGLKLREEESAIRKQALRFDNMKAKATMNHGNLNRVVMGADYTNAQGGYGSKAIADAMTKYLPDGIAYRHKGYQDNGLPIWEMGTLQTDLETGKAVQGPDGKAVFNSLMDAEGNPKLRKFGTLEEYQSLINQNLSPEWQLALQVDDRNYAKTERDHKDALRRGIETAAAEAGTEKGKVDLAHKRQLTQTSKASEAKLLADVQAGKDGTATKAQAPVSTRQGIGGAVKRTAKESDNDKTEFTARVKQYPNISLDQSFMISQIQGGNKKVSKAFSAALKDAVNSPEAMEQFLREATGPEVGLPLEYVQDLVAQAETLQQEYVQQGKKGDGWMEDLWEGIKQEGLIF